jgi:hypothetical protein
MTRINLVVAVLASAALLLASCGGGSSSNGGVAHLGTNTGSSTTTGEGAASPGSGSPEAAMLAFANCMRASGVPNFPDQSGSGTVRLGAGVDPSSPGFQAAQKACGKFSPKGGPPGSGPPPSAQTLAHYLTVAQCMRSHGVPEFPDPRTTVPSKSNLPGDGGEVSDIEGVILVFPHTIDTQSPAFARAAAACAFPLHNH